MGAGLRPESRRDLVEALHPAAAHRWVEETAGTLRLVAQEGPTRDPDRKAVSGYGVLRRQPGPAEPPERALRRFVDGRPVSASTEPVLDWCGTRRRGCGWGC
jgi:hypothetical protein